jgi:hypothetical protein
MTIEIHQPELQALIQRRISEEFATVEEALLQALRNSPEPRTQAFAKGRLGQILTERPLWGAGLETERAKDLPRVVEF